jgi:hypothetical protein
MVNKKWVFIPIFYLGLTFCFTAMSCITRYSHYLNFLFMKKLASLLICAMFPVMAFAQTTAVIYASGVAGAYVTGTSTYTPGTTTYTLGNGVISSTDSGIISKRGWAVFDLSSIPASSSISSVTLGFYVSGFTAGTGASCRTYGYAGDLSAVTTASTLFNDLNSGTMLWSSSTTTSIGTYGTGIGNDSLMSYSAGAVPNTFIAANAGSKISICFTGGGTNAYTITGESGAQTRSGICAPYLVVTYTSTVTACSGTPTPGTVSSSVSSACPTTSITLTNSGYSSSTTFQWQSSPDSMTWSNVAGATSATYGFTGLSATTYYRNVVTCSGSGLSSATAGVKISYAPTCACSGTPVGGTATASTTSCSACSLTLSVSGYTTGSGIALQWQSSPNNTTWSNMTGVTTASCMFSPTSSNYYRCKVTCSSGGIAYSSSVYVAYLFKIIADSISAAPDSLCSTPTFFAKVNGVSSLLRLKTYFGDGTRDSVALTTSGTSSYANASHPYTSPGNYTIKQIVYYNNTPQDSITFNYYHDRCKTKHVKFYVDVNNDCAKSTTESFNSYPVTIAVDSAGVTVRTLPATSGYYYKETGAPGTVYSYRILPGSMYVSCPSSGV